MYPSDYTIRPSISSFYSITSLLQFSYVSARAGVDLQSKMQKSKLYIYMLTEVDIKFLELKSSSFE